MLLCSHKHIILLTAAVAAAPPDTLDPYKPRPRCPVTVTTSLHEQPHQPLTSISTG